MHHAEHDRVSLAMARRVADELRRRPELVREALANLERWAARNAGSPGLLRCYEEWRSILNRPIEQVCDALLRTDDEGQRLRQNSPFAGVLSPQEVWMIKQQVRHEQNAA
jgi:hypothetical protein